MKIEITLPMPTCYKCGSEMKQKGYGLYPYNCINKEKYPNAMIYDGCINGHSIGWFTDTSDLKK